MMIQQNEERGVPLCQNQQERTFVEALLLHCRQKLRESPDEPIRMTHDQVKEIIHLRHEVKLDPQAFQRLKRKYVTSLPSNEGGEGRKAERFELLLELKKGSIGVPSEYEATGLLPALSPLASEST